MESDTAFMEQAFHSWPRLPTELQLSVLNHLFTSPYAIEEEDHDFNMKEDDLNSIVGVRNHHLVDLSLEVYYKCNDFIANNGWYLHLIRFPNPKYRCHIQHLSISLYECHIGGSATEFFFSRDSDWRTIIAPTEQLTPDPDKHSDQTMTMEEATRYSEWYRLFANLKVFYLYIRIFSDNIMSPEIVCNSDLYAKLLSTLASGKTRVHASKYSVSVHNTLCTDHPNKDASLGCHRSGEVVKQCLLSMLTRKQE
ncbi:hypothetical protein NX059_006996 [Plenodomus lindquistii]|nr:hypothetical protein NX059_006996 [Plenodomus lindquistii]